MAAFSMSGFFREKKNNTNNTNMWCVFNMREHARIIHVENSKFLGISSFERRWRWRWRGKKGFGLDFAHIILSCHRKLFSFWQCVSSSDLTLVAVGPTIFIIRFKSILDVHWNLCFYLCWMGISLSCFRSLALSLSLSIALIHSPTSRWLKLLNKINVYFISIILTYHK